MAAAALESWVGLGPLVLQLPILCPSTSDFCSGGIFAPLSKHSLPSQITVASQSL